MTREEVKARIEEIGIFPGIRVSTADQALYCARTLYDAGIPVAEITMTVPGATNVIGELAKTFPDMVVGAGTVLDKENAERCLDAGARFLTSTGLVPEVIESARKRGVVAIPGALTPTEVIAAWKAGADYIKIYPTAAVGGHLYIRSLKVPLPQSTTYRRGRSQPANCNRLHSVRGHGSWSWFGAVAERGHPPPPGSAHPRTGTPIYRLCKRWPRKWVTRTHRQCYGDS